MCIVRVCVRELTLPHRSVVLPVFLRAYSRCPACQSGRATFTYFPFVPFGATNRKLDLSQKVPLGGTELRCVRPCCGDVGAFHLDWSGYEGAPFFFHSFGHELRSNGGTSDQTYDTSHPSWN